MPAMDGRGGAQVVQGRCAHRRRPVDHAVVLEAGLIENEGVDGRITVHDLTAKPAAAVTRRASASARWTASLTSAGIGIRAAASSAHGHGQTRLGSRHSTSAARHAWARASAPPIRRRSATESTSTRGPGAYSSNATAPAGTQR